MNELWLKLKEWWQQLTLREKQTTATGSLILVLVIFYYGMWAPYLNHIAAMRKQIALQRKVLFFMQAADQEIQKLSAKTKNISKPISPVALLSDLQKRIEKAGLTPALTQLKEASNDTIEVHFTKVEFDKLMSMITTLMQEQSVSVQQLSATADTTPGIANVDFVLKM